MKTAVYMRVSTEDQRVDLQHDGLTSYAERAGMMITSFYRDEAVSGRQDKRPGLTELMKAARNHDFDCVLVWKFDRFARSTSHLLRALEEFNHLGIRFISVQDQIDTDSPMGKAMFTIIGAMAELESDLISERVRAGMAAAKRRGKHVGRPFLSKKKVEEVEGYARRTKLSIRKIAELTGVSKSRVGVITKEVRS